jgi:biotin operon repressor
VLLSGRYEPPSVKEIGNRLGMPEKKVHDHIAMLAREGRAVKVMPDGYSSRVKITKAMEGRRLDSRMANCIPSNRQPRAVH